MLEFKKISDDALNAMREVLSVSGDYYGMAVDEIRRLIPCDDVHILNSANSCLLVVAECVSGSVLVCDMGGWNGFIRSCELFGKEVEYLETNDGLINIEVLDNYLREHDVKSMYITSLAGYTAPQPLDDIQRVCDLHEVLLIVDISGSVGDEKTTQYGDILISSTGSPKIVNIENGGFICNRSEKEFNKHLIKSLRADHITCNGITNEIPKAPEILSKTLEMNRYLKDKLKKKNVELIHPDKYGLNTMIVAPSKSKAKQLAYNIRKRLKLNGNIITVGPNYNRVKRACVIIEVKNLCTDTLTIEDMDFLYDIIMEEYETTF